MEQHLGQRLRQQFDQLTPNEQKVAGFILDHFDDVAVYSAADLARLTGVSKATVSRLFRRLGFASFSEVRQHARELRYHGVPLVTDSSALGSGLERFQRHFERERDNLHQMLAAIDAGTFDALVEALDCAPEVLVIGYRNGYPPALHLRQQLMQVRPGVRLAPLPGQSLGEELVGVPKGTLAIVMGFRRRAHGFSSLLEQLKDGGVDTLLIGDPTLAAAGASPTWQLECPLDSVSAFDSYTSVMSLINLLSNALLHKRLGEGRARIDAISEAYSGLEELS
ncbi:MurR/RpiR family transcriptional regulator [Kushneria indalinina]|uniref:RpiR family transcriptional regulator n=1 Tax=Kushneria indalinina DSM 14324 TaxID=1122140 RepID=A0A3D9DT64_9GAMM|nr:MurR/RpiR family transcriptional regulator [Kushneria indalinina]REC93619.1 RpiR family transcriptional regulator [Kushneria indalinina DSM 14324]